MTVFIYVDTSKQVGDRDHLKVFDSQAAAQAWFDQHDPEGVAFEYEVSSLMTTGEAHDRFQQEVDHILDDLMRTPWPGVSWTLKTRWYAFSLNEKHWR
jgi:hypothetical protein